MDEPWNDTIEALERIWPRVHPDAPFSSTEAPKPPKPAPPESHRPEPPRPARPPRPPEPVRPSAPELRMLEKLIHAEAEAGMRYMALAGRTSGKAGAALKRLAGGSSRLLKRLQEEYFMRTGDTCPVPRKRGGTHPLPEELRQLWNRAGEGEQDFLRAAAECGDPGLRTLYGDAAEFKRRQGQTLRELVHLLF